MAKPILHGPGYSTYTRTARIALAEKGVEYALNEIDFIGGGGFPAGFEKLHPFSKVPVLEHDGFSIFETAAITRYLDEAFTGASLQPKDVKQRARMAQAIGIIDNYLYQPAVHGVFIQRALVPKMGGETDEAKVAESAKSAGKALAALESLLAGQPWLSGAQFGLADAHLAPVIDYFSQVPEGQAALAQAPAVSRWWQAAQSRDSVRQTQPNLG